MRILAIVITYFPDVSVLQADVSSFKDYVDKVLIWENTPTVSNDGYRLPPDDKIEYCGGKGNVGIPKALNYAWHYAVDNQYDYVLTMDQDSEWQDFKAFLDATVLSHAGDQCIWGGYHRRRQNNESGYNEVPYVITSGMIVSTETLNITQGWPETFKIDCVDMDFCYNARKHGIGVRQVKGAFLTHRIGEKQKVRSMKTLRHKEIIVHSAQRTYGIIRNGIIMGKKYKNFPTKRYLYDNIWQRLSAIILYENDKAKKLSAIGKALMDGFLYQYAKRNINK